MRPPHRQHRRANACARAIEPLEQRILLSIAPAGPEFPVNTFTTGQQVGPAVAMDANGDYVVAWTSIAQDGDGNGVYAQRYDVTGKTQGAEFRVNTYTTSNQGVPAAAMDASGNFIITWQ